MKAYAIKVIGKRGGEDFLRDAPTQRPTKFPSRAAAARQVDFMRIGIKNDYQSINVVVYPKEPKQL